MSEDKSKSKNPSSDELNKYKKEELMQFLKSRGVKQSGTRKVLLSVAKLVAKRPVLTVSSVQTPSAPNDQVVVWHNSATEVAPIPKQFTLEPSLIT